jgi:putative transposase
LIKVGVKTLFIEPGSPWENGYVESFNGKLRDELLNGEIFYTLLEAKVLIERWREHYNRVRPHSALGYRPPAPEAILLPEVLGGSGRVEHRRVAPPHRTGRAVFPHPALRPSSSGGLRRNPSKWLTFPTIRYSRHRSWRKR